MEKRRPKVSGRTCLAFLRGFVYLAPNGERLFFNVPGTTHGFISAQKRSDAIAFHVRHWREAVDGFCDEVVFLSRAEGIASETASDAAIDHVCRIVKALVVKGVFILRDAPIAEPEVAS